MRTATILIVVLICALAMSGCVLYPAGGPHGGAVVVDPVPRPAAVVVHPHRPRVVRPVRPVRPPVVVIP